MEPSVDPASTSSVLIRARDFRGQSGQQSEKLHVATWTLVKPSPLGCFSRSRYLLTAANGPTKKKVYHQPMLQAPLLQLPTEHNLSSGIQTAYLRQSSAFARALDASRGWPLLIAATEARSERKHATSFRRQPSILPRGTTTKKTKTTRKLFTDAANSLIPFSTPDERSPFFKHGFTTLLVFETLQGPGQAALICALLCA